MPSKGGRYAASQRRDNGAEDRPRSGWASSSTASGGGWEPGDQHPCAGGCGKMVPTNKCSECAARAVGDWLRATKNTNAKHYQEQL